MTINSTEILNRLDSIESLEVRDSTGSLKFVADLDHIRRLCLAGHVCGSARGRHIRYLELIVPLDEAAHSSDSQSPERARSGCVGEDSRTVRRGEDLLANTYSHDLRRCGAYGGTREAYFTLSA